MLIQISRRGVLRCVRGDGSVIWQKQGGRNAGFFALHDLTHFAVESVLGVRRGFFGLIAEGWDVEDMTGKGVRGALPGEAGGGGGGGWGGGGGGWWGGGGGGGGGVMEWWWG